MQCHVCNAEVGEGQRFCHECGQSLAGVTDATQELTRLPTEEMDADADGADATDESDDADAAVAGATAAATAVTTGDPLPAPDPSSTIDTADLPVTQPLDEMPTDEPVASDTDTDTGAPDPAATQPIDAIDASTADDAPTAAAHAGPIGASLFDPATAPPVAEPEWGEPIPAFADDMFGTDLSDEATVAVAEHDAAATTTIPEQDPAATGVQPIVYDVDADHDEPPLLDGEIQPFRVRPAFVLAILGMLATLMVSVADLTDIRTDRVVAGIENRLSTIDDIGTNLAVAGFIGAAVMLVGGLLQCFHLRWGAGMAGGAGLALVGWASLTLGLAEVPIDSARRITRDPATPGPFTLTVTRDLGYWLLVAVAVIGLLVFVASLTSAGTGGRRGLDPWTAALGAVAALVVAAGPLITVGGASFDVNFGTENLPAAFFAGRLGQLGLIALTGVLGFLLVRTYGLGLVGGGVSVAIWLWISSLLEIGDRPLGIAAGNLGSSDTSPHAVTTTGVALTLVMLLAASTIAVVQRRRARRPRRVA